MKKLLKREEKANNTQKKEESMAELKIYLEFT